ncbi:MAG: hypothetical protein JRF63_16015, partial [Deltaproteobacteria bacterium]|nr:hypothetical protein [Deltaproteobacteria bacterium]
TETDTSTASACLVISEYLEGSSNNKGLELYNCGSSALDLTDYSVCVIWNENTECGSTLDLTGSLAVGEVLTICNAELSTSVYDGVCSFTSDVTWFNGNERLLVMHGTDVIDAFGQPDVQPSGTPWAEMTLRRCDLTPFLGDVAFDYAAYYNEYGQDDFSDFGIVPSESDCGFVDTDTDTGTGAEPDIWAIQAHLVTPDVVHDAGVMLFDVANHKITCVGDATACPISSDATVLDYTDHLVFPGLIDIHNHMSWAALPKISTPGMVFSRRYDWRASDHYDDFKSNRPTGYCLNVGMSEIMAALAGTTAVQSPTGTQSCYQGMVRNLFNPAHGFNGGDDPPFVCTQLDISESSGYPDDQCVGDARVHAHIAEGVGRFSNLEFSQTEWLGLLHDGLIVVHGVGLTAFDLGKATAAGSGLVWSPRNSIHLYNAGPDLVTAKNLGLPIALAPDWPATGGVNQLSEIKCADQLDTNFYGDAFTDQELVQMVTRVPGELTGLGSGSPAIGQLAAGFYADFVIVDGNTSEPFRALIDAQPYDLVGTFVGGELIAGDQSLSPGERLRPDRRQPGAGGVHRVRRRHLRRRLRLLRQHRRRLSGPLVRLPHRLHSDRVRATGPGRGRGSRRRRRGERQLPRALQRKAARLRRRRFGRRLRRLPPRPQRRLHHGRHRRRWHRQCR